MHRIKTFSKRISLLCRAQPKIVIHVLLCSYQSLSPCERKLLWSPHLDNFATYILTLIWNFPASAHAFRLPSSFFFLLREIIDSCSYTQKKRSFNKQAQKSRFLCEKNPNWQDQRKATWKEFFLRFKLWHCRCWVDEAKKKWIMINCIFSSCLWLQR